jgi:hypothetical protein
MSAGAQVCPIRLSEGTLCEIRQVMESRNNFTSRTPWTFSDFIREAIREKIAHMKRSRKTRKGRRKADARNTVSASDILL